MNNSDRANLLFYLILGFVFLFFPFFFKSDYFISSVVLMLVNIAMAVSLRMVLISGQLHLCHAAFMGIGAYASASLVNEAGLSFWLSLPLAAGISAIIGSIIGFITLRLKGLYFLFVTFCLGEIFRLGIANGPKIFGGYTGLTTIPISPIVIPGLFTLEFTSKVPCYYLLFILIALSILIAYRVDKTRYGLILRGVEQNETILQSLGINTANYKLMAFVLSCTIAGFIGSYWAHYFLVISPDAYGLWASIYFIVYIQVGGLSSISGAILGAISLTFLRELFRPINQFEPIILGIILIITIYFMPGGLFSLFNKLLFNINKIFFKRKQTVTSVTGN